MHNNDEQRTRIRCDRHILIISNVWCLALVRDGHSVCQWQKCNIWLVHIEHYYCFSAKDVDDDCNSFTNFSTDTFRVVPAWGGVRVNFLRRQLICPVIPTPPECTSTMCVNSLFSALICVNPQTIQIGTTDWVAH